MLLGKISETLLGKRLDPFSGQTRQHIALIAFLAWVGLGADGLSSSCYGPKKHSWPSGDITILRLYMALATAITVFVIAIAYNQVIELFPTGGGGYKVATSLIGPHAGLISAFGTDRRLCADHRNLGCQRRRRRFQSFAGRSPFPTSW